MAKPIGIIQVSGKVGNLVYSHRGGKGYVKKAADQPMKHTEATNKAKTDFGAASKMSARIRKAFAPMVDLYGDITLVSRVIKTVLEIFRTIENPILGQKSIAHGDVSLFEEFEFNGSKKLDTLIRQRPIVELESAGLAIQLPADTIEDLFKPIAKAKKAVIQLRVCNLSLSNGEDQLIPIKDLIIPLNATNFNGARLKVPLIFKDEQLIIVGLGLHFLDDGMIRDKTKKAAAIVYSTKLKDGVEVIFMPAAMPSVPLQQQNEGLAWELE